MFGKFKIPIIVLFLQIILIESFFQPIMINSNQPNEEFEEKLSFINLNKTLTNSRVTFTKNHNQLDNNKIKLYTQNDRVWFTDDGVWFELRENTKNRGHDGIGIWKEELIKEKGELELTTDNYQPMTYDYKRVVIKQEFVNANDVEPVGKERLNWNSNFFYGNDSSKWCTDVPNYAEVWYENLYDGIDLKYYTNKDNLKYDFIVHPGANPEQVKIRYVGIERLELDELGNMRINTELNALIDGKPIIYQKFNKKCQIINARFKIFNNNEYGFEIQDEFARDEILIIDPIVQINYSTFIGGFDYDKRVGDIFVDSNDNVYLTGVTISQDFPTTPGVYNDTYNNEYDTIILKLNQNGTELIFSTFIGGNNRDVSYDLVIDDNNNIYLTGETNSNDFPTTVGVFDRTINNNTNNTIRLDIFVCKLNSNGSQLIYSTYLGGDLDELSPKISLDSSGNAFITGRTNSPNLPITQGAFQTNYCGENQTDIFISKFNINGSQLIYSTYLGGIRYDIAGDIEIDTSGNAYILGETTSDDFPTTPNAFDRTHKNNFDVVISILNYNGSDLLYSTFIGGSLNDYGYKIKIDSYGNIYAAGVTVSIDFPTTVGAYDTTQNGFWDGFIFKLNLNSSTLNFSTYIGGSLWDWVDDFELDPIGNLYMTGKTYSTDFPITPGAIKNSTNNNDVFLAKFNSNCSVLLYSTYVGETNDSAFSEQAVGIGMDSINNVIISGFTNSSEFPTTPGSFDTSFNGKTDIFVTKLSIYNEINITSLYLLLNSTPTEILFAKYDSYTIRVNVTDTNFLWDIGIVRLTLDPFYYNIQLIWKRSNGKFIKLNDPNNYIILEPTSVAYFDVYKEHWSINFNITVNWTYSNEYFNDVKIFASGLTLPSSWYNVTNFYRVENDLVFDGILSVECEDKQVIKNNDWVRGGEQLTWTGLIPIYENSTDVYPPDDDFDITIWDEEGNYWSDSPELGQPMNITMITPKKTTGSYNYTINLTGIPPECDKTNYKFTIRIDADNVTFSNEWPGKNAWQKSSEVYTGITITDHGGGFVDNTSIMHSISEDNGATWTDWNSTDFIGGSESITIPDFVRMNDGDDNLIKWRAKDSLGNGPAESEPYRILVDTKPVYFSNPVPLPTHESSTGEVGVGITIIDNTSGVNASNIKYSTSINSGTTWSSWKTVAGFQNGNNVDVRLNLTFPNGTGNRIRWRAYDIAGNGPAYSDEYIINVYIPTHPDIIIPELQLFSPANNSKLTITPVKLTWEIINNYRPNIVFDIKLDTTNPPHEIIEQDYTVTDLIVDQLENRQTYYWTVIPKLNNINGSCQSGIWSFTVELPLPKVTLLTPANGSKITSTRPTLTWDLEYTGSSMVEYDIHFGTDMDPAVYQSNITTKYFSIDLTLEDNTTYYWYIEPWAGGLKGYRSPVWSFTVKLKQDNNISKFGIELKLDPDPLEIKPGEVKFVSAIVTNLGELNDNFTISISDINSTILNAEVYRQDTLEIAPGMDKEFLIMISVKDGAEPGYGNITITAKSNLAEKYNLHTQDSQRLSIKILEKDIQKEKERGQPINIFYFSILLLIIILIIISIIILIIVRKKSLKKDNEEIETQDIVPETSQVSITTPEPEPTVELVPPMPVQVQVQQPEDIQITQQDEQEE